MSGVKWSSQGADDAVSCRVMHVLFGLAGAVEVT
jgi:hypothetical protein